MKIPKLAIVLFGVTIIAVTTVLVYFLRVKPGLKTQSISITESAVRLSPSPELISWIDQADFRFDYPKDVTVNSHEEDKQNYAHVELSSSNHPGGVIVWVKDVVNNDIEKYLQKENVGNLIETTLGEEEAKKGISQTDTTKITIALIHDGYLYQVDGNLQDNSYWKGIFDQVISSFQFIQPTQAPDTSNGTNASDDSETGSDVDVIE